MYTPHMRTYLMYVRTICANVLYFAHRIHAMEHYMHIWEGKGSWKLKFNRKLYLDTADDNLKAV